MLVREAPPRFVEALRVVADREVMIAWIGEFPRMPKQAGPAVHFPRGFNDRPHRDGKIRP